jgi:hypothetical protein
MSKLEITVLTPRTPYQTYLEERLQSAAGFGWTLPAHEPRNAAQRQASRDATSEALAVAPFAEPA